MALRPAFPPLATVAATLLALALAALLIAPVDVAKPAAPDTPDGDGDGLLDSFEVEIGTLPYDADTDDDGYEDGVDAYPLHPHRH
jgi:hypothetical protein